jgi:hypothetical protein
MKAIACALAILVSVSFVATLSGCAEDNDKKANITSDPNPTGGVAPNRPSGAEENKKLAQEQMKRNQSRPDYPKPQQ